MYCIFGASRNLNIFKIVQAIFESYLALIRVIIDLIVRLLLQENFLDINIYKIVQIL